MNEDDPVDKETGRVRFSPDDEGPRPGSASSSEIPSDVQQPLVIKEESEWSPSRGKEDPKPFNIKEEQEEIWTGQEGEQLHQLEEADTTRLPFTVVTMKSEDDDEVKPQISHCHQCKTDENRGTELSASSSVTEIKTEIDGEDAGRSEGVRRQDPEIPVDVQQLLVTREKVPPELSSSFDQKDPETLHIKEEQEELWTSQDGEQFNGLQDIDVTRFTITAVTVKSEEDCGGYEPARNRYQDSELKPNTGDKASDCFEIEVSCDDWQEPLSDSGPEKPFDCKFCQKRFSELGNLKTHIRVHTGEKPFGCDVCHKRFTQQESLNKHMRTHTGQKPFSCDDCGKSFAEQGNLKRHMRVHTGEKPFGCDICSKRFTQQESLKKHMRVHTGEKPFGCDVCGNRFKQQANLSKHMKVHTGEKPFSCDICGKRFSEQGKLKRHMSVHTGEKPFACDICEKRFAEQCNLRTHMRVHTKLQPYGCEKN